ncbi:MAG: glutaminyl-peptide cyclotransferase, partial [Dehalococcoidia bacterium]|nr:glutaminyl-peptide cyclotransferase [Dehalococcoidia bacterium]
MIRLKSLFAATCLLVSAVVFAGCSVPTATPTAPATATPMATATAAPTAIVAPTATANITPTQTPLPTPTLSPTQLPTPTAVATPTPAPASVPSFTYEVVNVYPHDADAFTQGLVFDGGALYEGTGIYGKSSLRKVRLDTGEVLQRRDLAADLFGEGIAVYGDNRDRIVQLTWRNHTGFVYDKNTFQSLRTFSYPTTEGWGITYDGRRLIMSDGTATLRFLDPDTLAETGSVQVYDGNGPVAMLNE